MPLSAKNTSPKAAAHGIPPDNISSSAPIYDPDSRRGEGHFSSLHLNPSVPHQHRIFAYYQDVLANVERFDWKMSRRRLICHVVSLKARQTEEISLCFHVSEAVRRVSGLHASVARAPRARVGFRPKRESLGRPRPLVSAIPSTALIVPVLAVTRENEKNRHQTSLTKPFLIPDRQAFLCCLLDLCFSVMSSGVNSLRGRYK